MIVVNNKEYSKMKKSSFVICTMVIAFCTVFVSCKKIGKESPYIFFNYGGVVKNNGDEIDAKVGDEVTIIVEYCAQGSLNWITLSIESDNRIYEDIFLGCVFITNTHHKIRRTIKFENAEDVIIKTSVADKQKEPHTTNFEMKVKVK